MTRQISVILPAYNEMTDTLDLLVKRIMALGPRLNGELEVLIVDDGSQSKILSRPEVKVIRHPKNLGNGAAIKMGARNAKGKILIFMDADGQHDPNDIPRLLETLEEGYDMVVGARKISNHASLGRRLGNGLFNKLASFMTGHKIEDLTSGFRAVKADKFRRFLYLLPNGFSYPTTITMAFFRSGYPVAYVPIRAEQRAGESKIKVSKDGLRFFIIILKIGALFSPMRLFFPVSLTFFLLGLCYYAYTYSISGRFTNMSALLFIASMLTFLIGIVSEQISALHYKGTEEKDDGQKLN